MSLKREYQATQETTANTAVGSSEDIFFGSYSMMRVYAPDTWTAAVITFYGQSPIDGTFKALQDSDGNVLTMSLNPGDAREAPICLFTENVIRITSDQAANNTETLGISLKG